MAYQLIYFWFYPFSLNNGLLNSVILIKKIRNNDNNFCKIWKLENLLRALRNIILQEVARQDRPIEHGCVFC